MVRPWRMKFLESVTGARRRALESQFILRARLVALVL